jgi:predicted metal-dependent hydrolase
MRPVQPELPFWGGVGEELPRVRAHADGELRRVLLGDRFVPYVLRRGRRRTIGLTIDHRGLRVGAPNRSTLGEIESLIRKHAAWVVDKLDSWRSRPNAEALSVVDGLEFPVLGRPVVVRLVGGGNTFKWRIPPCGDGAGADELELALREGANAATLLERALRTRAREVFADRMADFCARFSITPPRLSLSSARTRWGSCSHASGVRLNWRLIHAPPELLDYVVAHELAHLKQMNHTARFWSEVGKMYPGWREARAALRDLGDVLPRFA